MFSLNYIAGISYSEKKNIYLFIKIKKLDAKISTPAYLLTSFFISYYLNKNILEPLSKVNETLRI